MYSSSRFSKTLWAVLFLTIVSATGVWAFSGKAPKEAASKDETVWVQRPDGGQQCSPDTAQGLEAGSKELTQAGIHVMSSRKGVDGKMRIQMCGTPTGKQNSYQIRRSELARAMTLGFQEAAAPTP